MIQDHDFQCISSQYKLELLIAITCQIYVHATLNIITQVGGTRMMLCTPIFARGQNLDQNFLLLHCINLMIANIIAKILL